MEQSSSGRFAGGHSFDNLALELPAGGVRVDLDHDHQRVGELIYGEVADDGRLNCVAVLDDDAVTRIEQPVYFSSELAMTGPGVRERSYVARQAELLSIALTLNPASLEAREISWMPGDVRSSFDRSRWALSWRSSNPLLARALDSRQGMLTRSAARIVDRRRQSRLDNLVGRRAGSVHPSELELADEAWMHRPLRHSGLHRGILRVR